MKKRLVFFGFFFFLCTLFASAQTRHITGTVTSSDDGKGIPGVSVVVKGTVVGVQTDLDGRYSLNVPEDAAVLVFSFVGMKTQEITISENTVNVVMEVESTQIEEVMVVAYGTAKKSSFTGSAHQISAEKINARPITNISKAIEGTSAGVQVSSGTGQPGSGLDIRIRGIGSINASNDPLYIVDGVPYNGSLANLNSNDIESISLLKDAGSTALYGNKAANGVVMITTKKGNKDNTVIQFMMSKGVTSRALPEYKQVNAKEYYPLMWEAYRNSVYYVAAPPTLEAANTTATNGIVDKLGYNPFNVAANLVVGTDGKLNPDAKLLWADDLDWFSPILRTGQRSDYSLSLSGGSEKSDYFFSLGYLNDKGYQIKTDYERVTARMTVNTQPKKWLKTGLNLSATLTESNQTAADGGTSYVNPFYFSRSMGPIYPVYAHDPVTGEYLIDPLTGKRFFDFGNMTDLGLPTRPSGASSGRHSVAETNLNSNLFKRNALGGRTYFEFYILDGLKFTTNVSVDVSNNYASTYDNKIIGDGAPAGRADKTNDLTTTINFNQLLAYGKSFGKHSFDVLLGHESNSYENNNFYGSRKGIIVDGNYELINFTTITGLNSYSDNETSEGYFSRFNYNYEGKYYLSGSYRLDGSSRFHEDQRWGNFWSVGLAWRADQEAFIKDLKWIDMLKVRTSYGELGNNKGIGYYTYQDLFDLGWNNGIEPGIQYSQIGNEKLTWESNATFDLGLEFDLFKRVSGTVEYFNRISSNLLFSVPQPTSSGIKTQMQNIGAMSNKGFEIRFAVDVLKRKDFNWNVDANVTTFTNRVTKMPDGQTEIISGTKKLMKGHSMYDYWLRDWVGVDPSDGAALYAGDMDLYSTATASNYRIIGEDTLSISQNYAKFHYAGSSLPDFYGGITNAFTYKDFSLSVLFTYSVGGKTYDGIYAGLMHSGNYGRSLSKDALKRWEKPGDKTDVPRMDFGKQSQYGASSDRWLIDASYLALKSINLSYNLPSKWAKKAALKKATVYVSGENLWMLSKRTGMNPQQSFTGVTSNIYTPSKVITIGINVSL